MRRRGPLLCAALALACASVPETPRARLAVEILSGFPARPEAASPRDRVELLVDATLSMRRVTAAGPERVEVVRRVSERLLYALPEDAQVGLHVLGAAPGRCGQASELGRSGPGQARAPLVERLAEIDPAGEGSVAEALSALAGRLERAVAFERSRVAVVTDLESPCGGDLCASLSRLVARGARVELVVLGAAPAPACAADLGLADAPGWAAPSPPPRFWVEGHPRGELAEPSVIGAGRADGVPRSVPAGSGVVVVDGAPPARFGPIPLAADALTRVTILDFPALDPPVREWSWSAEATPGHGPPAP